MGSDGPVRGGVALNRRLETVVHIPAPPADVFARLDDQTRLAEHMEKPSAMMGGGRMTYDFDAGRGQAVGSHIRMGGTAFGIRIFVDEVITERVPPRRKTWRTQEPVRLIVIGAYAMGFDVAGEGEGARLSVWIDYGLPRGSLRWLARPLAAIYARWCVGRMAGDAARHFAIADQPRRGRTRPF
jgi:hypothetical protein